MKRSIATVGVAILVGVTVLYYLVDAVRHGAPGRDDPTFEAVGLMLLIAAAAGLVLAWNRIVGRKRGRGFTVIDPAASSEPPAPSRAE